MKFIVAEMTRFEVDAETSDAAIESVKQKKVQGKTFYTCKAETDIKPVPQSQPLPLNQWPFWAKAFKQFAKPEDKGIGDVVARTIGAENSEAFKSFYKKVTGKDCGCTGRQARWNLQYPLTH